MAIEQKITPFLWFDSNAEEAVGFYTSLTGFPGRSTMPACRT